MFLTLILGAIVCGAGLKWGVFHWQAPRWLTLEGLVKLFIKGASAIGRKGGWRFTVWLGRRLVAGGVGLVPVCIGLLPALTSPETPPSAGYVWSG